MILLVAIFIAVPLLELYVILQVGGAIGVLPTLALLLGISLFGAGLLSREGRSAWRRFTASLAERRFPGREVADGVMITVGGALLLTPGFITDAVGLLLLIPPTRALARRLLHAYVARRFLVVDLGTRAAGRADRPGRREYDFESTAEEADDEDPRLPGGPHS